MLFTSTAESVSYTYSKEDNLIGNITVYRTKKDDSLIEIGRRFSLGYNEITDANADLDPFLPGHDKDVLIPTKWILPDMQVYEGIVINLPEMRLYYFYKQDSKNMVRTFPIGIGDEGTDTPTGVFKITQKTVNPSWYPPESIRKERPELPAVVPPGPENPLGSHAMRLSGGSYLIHGTNRPWAVGRRVTHGCLRLYPEEMPLLFNMVQIGTKVTIVRQPVKIGQRGDNIFIEVHKIEGNYSYKYFDEAIGLLIKKDLLKKVDTLKLYEAIKNKTGVPVDITEIKTGAIKAPVNFKKSEQLESL